MGSLRSLCYIVITALTSSCGVYQFWEFVKIRMLSHPQTLVFLKHSSIVYVVTWKGVVTYYDHDGNCSECDASICRSEHDARPTVNTTTPQQSFKSILGKVSDFARTTFLHFMSLPKHLSCRHHIFTKEHVPSVGWEFAIQRV